MDEPQAEPQHESISAEAERIVQSRMGSYGPPTDHWKATGEAWSALIVRWLESLPESAPNDPPIPPRIVGLMFIVDKCIREAFQHKRDNLVDICGYALGIESGETAEK